MSREIQRTDLYEKDLCESQNFDRNLSKHSQNLQVFSELTGFLKSTAEYSHAVKMQQNDFSCSWVEILKQLQH